MSDTEPSPNLGYETTDVSAMTLLVWVGFLVAVIALAGVAAWVYFDVLAGWAALRDPKVSPLSPVESQMPPEPRLIVKEHQDLLSVQKQEEEVLDSYAWVDKDRGIVRIPIARAMELIAQEGLQNPPSPSKTP
jgi:hypothetical protein